MTLITQTTFSCAGKAKHPKGWAFCPFCVKFIKSFYFYVIICYDQNICISRTEFFGGASCPMLPCFLSMCIQVITFITKFGMKIRLRRWGLGMDKLCHPILCNGYNVNYVSMLGLKLIHVSRSPSKQYVYFRASITTFVHPAWYVHASSTRWPCSFAHPKQNLRWRLQLPEA